MKFKVKKGTIRTKARAIYLNVLLHKTVSLTFSISITAVIRRPNKKVDIKNVLNYNDTNS